VIQVVVAAGGLLIILVLLWEVFESVVLPRRVTRQLRFARLFYRVTWKVWKATALQLHSESARETYLSLFGPLSLLLLLSVWAVSLITGFAMLHWGLGSGISDPEGLPSFASDLYLSASTLFTLGLGDVAPISWSSRAVTVIEAGTGFGFLALVIGYLPVLYQAFSRREVSISLLDSRAGSPPNAAELFRRYWEDNGQREGAIYRFLGEWERWSAELLESHLSYPSLAYFRSQHERQSWLASLTFVMDVCALIMATEAKGGLAYQAKLTFAIARHAAVDLSQVFNIPPTDPMPERLSSGDAEILVAILSRVNVIPDIADLSYQKLASLRLMYKPYVNSLAQFLLMPLPYWLPSPDLTDDWQTSAWEHARGRE